MSTLLQDPNPAIMTAPPHYQNSLLALFSPKVTNLTTQPPIPSASELRARRRTLLGIQLPVTQQGNNLADLYNPTGTVLTLRGPADLLRAVGHPQMLGTSDPETCTFPIAIELSAPWSLGAAGQQTDVWLALALLVQVTTGLSTCSLSPGPDDVRACDFTITCRRESPEYSTDFAAERALRCIPAVAPFRSPNLFMLPIRNAVGDEDILPSGRRRQRWWPWQACANCLAVRAVKRCTSWRDALAVSTPIRVFDPGPGEESEWDRAYAWFNESWRDYMLTQSLGFYELWTGRDGVTRREASIFVAPTFIDNHTNTKTPEGPRYCYHPVRSYKAYR